MKWISTCLLLCIFPAMAGSLQDQLDAQLDAGTLTFSPVEAALVAEGAADADTLAGLMARYEALKTDMALSPKQAGAKPGKKAKYLHKAVFEALKIEGDAGDGLTSLLQDKAFTPVGATFIMADAAAREGLSPADWAGETDKLDPAFADKGATAEEALAALLTFGAFHTPDDQPRRILQMLRLATLLAPTSTYAPGELDKYFYNRGLKLFNDDQVEAAAMLTLGACTRYPAQELFQPLAYNLGLKLTADEAGDEARNMALAGALQPFMGTYAEGFAKAADARNYNRAADLYNAKDYEAALIALEAVKNPPNPDNFKRVLASTYVFLVERRTEEGKTEEAAELKARLAALDPEKAETLEKRLAQLKLKDMVENGDMAKALAEAATRLDTEVDRTNYKSVLVGYSQGLRAAGKYEEALAVLDQVPAAAQLGETAGNLRFNTYSDWLDSIDQDAYQQLIPVYRRLHEDKGVTMTKENAAILRENYGNALYAEVVKLIEDRKFAEADRKSKAALKIAPDHKLLLEQRTLVDTIMRRISQ